ncbi:hypothetical protein [Streptosporangium sp. NPDC048865]|uniref:hypothetical protein n=1 Tax=Streptosporangium sp. NPDC048865 TaxID=3155766 RepID=UPI00341B8BE3
MRIRMLAVATLTAGALMATLTGAASADGTPTPAPVPSSASVADVVLIQCEGGGQVTLTTRRLTEAEREKLEKEGVAHAVPAVPALPPVKAGELKKPEVREFRRAESGGVMRPDDVLKARPDAEPPALPEGVPPRGTTKTMTASPLPEGAPKPGEPATLSGAVPAPDGAVPAPDGAVFTEVTVTGRQAEGDAPTVTCVNKAKAE